MMETKEELELQKLKEEIKELRSRLRRAIGTFGGLVGVATAIIGAFITIDQFNQARSTRATEEKTRAIERQTFEAEKSEVRLKIAELKEMETNARTKDSELKLAASERRRAEAEQAANEATKLASEQQSLAAKIRQERLEVDTLLRQTQEKFVALTSEVAELGKQAERQPSQKTASDSAARIVEKATEDNTALAQSAVQAGLSVEPYKLSPKEKAKLVEDRTKARVFVFAIDAAQSEAVWAWRPGLEAKGFSLVNSVIAPGKREPTPVVRYFRHPQDREEAAKIAEALTELGLPEPRVSYVIDPDSIGSGRKYQVWLRPENLRSGTD